MTPKEKAKELTNKFLKTGMMIRRAKQCALICVDEKIEVLNHLYHGYEKENSLVDKMKVYYNEVKQEIEKL